MLTGLIECGECGSKMGGHRTINNQKRVYTYYICKGCGNKVNKLDIESKTFEVMVNKIFSEKSIVDYTNRMNEHIKNRYNKSDSELNKLKSLISRLDKEIGNIVNVITRGISSSALEEKLQTLEQAKKDACYELLIIKNS